MSTISAPKPDIVQTAGILGLPDELLLEIAKEFHGDLALDDLRHLALAQRRFRHVVHKMLIRNGVVPMRSIPRYVELVSKHSDWICHIKKIKLVDGKTVNNTPGSNVSQSAVGACYGLVRALWSHILGNQEEEFRREMKSSGLWALVLFAAFGNLRELSLEFKNSHWPEVYHTLLLSPAYQIQMPLNILRHYLYEVLAKRLEVLCIMTDMPVDQMNGHPIKRLELYHMERLKTLTVSGKVLWHSMAVPLSVLPANLEVLQIYCDQSTCPWFFLEQLHFWMSASNHFARLRQVQLFFSLPCRSLARYVVCQAKPARILGHGNITISKLLDDWKKLGTSFETYFLNRGEPGQSALDPRQYRQSCLLEEIKYAMEKRGRPINSSV